MAKAMICPNCFTQGKPKLYTKGSILIELVLWLCLIVPGVIYSLWRHTSGRYWGCSHCGAGGLVPLDSPRGRQLTAGQADA